MSRNDIFEKLIMGLIEIYGELLVRIDYDKFIEWEDVLPFYKNVKKDGVVLWQAA